MKIKTIAIISNSLEDFRESKRVYRDLEWTLVTEQILSSRYMDYYIDSYILIFVKEVD